MFRGTLHFAILVDWNSCTHLDNGTTVRIGKYIIKGRNASMLNPDFTKAIFPRFSLYKKIFLSVKKNGNVLNK